MRRAIFILLILSFYGIVYAEDLTLGVDGAACGGSCDWTDPDNVVFGTSAGEVGPGDTLYICGAFDDDKVFLEVTESGTDLSSNALTIDGDCSTQGGTDGSIWAAKKLASGSWVDQGDNTYTQSCANVADEYIESDGTILTEVSSIAEAQSTDSSMYATGNGGTCYYNPAGSVQDVYSSFGYGVRIAGYNYIIIQNLTIYGGSSGGGNIELTDSTPAGSSNIIIQDNSLWYCLKACVSADLEFDNIDGVDGITIRRNDFRHFGIAAIFAPATSTYNLDSWVISDNYIRDGDIDDELCGNPGGDCNDGHGVWFNSGSNITITNNYFKNLINGIAIWNGDAREISNVTISYNKFEAFSNPGLERDDQVYGIRLGGGNTNQDSDRMDNVQILYNVFDDLVEVTDDGGGPEDCWLQIKNQEGGSGTDPVVYGNTFTDYNCAIHLYDGGNTDYAVSVKNNIFDTPKSGGYHINVESFSGNGDNVFVDYNVYYPDTSGSDNVWTWDGTNCTDYDDWKTDSGQDGNSPADVADPLLQADCTLGIGSAALDAGVDLGATYDDALDPDSTWPAGTGGGSMVTADQDDYGSGWEVGAFVSDSTFVVSSSGTDNAGCVSLPQNNDCNTIQYIFDNVDLTGGYTIRVDDNQTLTADIVFGSNDSGTTGNPLILEGLNNQVTIDGNSAVSNVIDTSGEDHLIIRNLRITGSTSRGVFVQSNGGEPLDEIELDNLYIYENDGVGLHIKGSSATNNIANNAITVTDCSFVDNGNHGAFTGGHTGATAPVTYTNCTATNNTWHGFSSKSEEELLTGGGNWGTGNDYDHDISNESRSGETIYRVTNETTGAIGTEVACGALDANNEWCQDGDTLYWYHDTTDPDTENIRYFYQRTRGIVYSQCTASSTNHSGNLAGNGFQFDDWTGGTVERCQSYDNDGVGIQTNRSENVVLKHNLVWNNGQNSGNPGNLRSGIGVTTTSKTVEIYNNTIYSPDYNGQRDGIWLSDYVTDITLKNNITVGNSQYGINTSGTGQSGITCTNNATYNNQTGDTNNITCTSGVTDDPVFLGASGDNFKLNGASPCIDAGADLGDGSSYLDYDGKNQDDYGSGWEIGAYVYEELFGFGINYYYYYGE